MRHLNCPICDELQARQNSRLGAALADGRTRNAVFSTTRRFALIPTVGPLVAGHSLIVSRKHQNNLFAGVSHATLEEVFVLLDRFISDNATAYGNDLFCFEHGALNVTDCDVLCSTIHAHLHTLPISKKAIARLLRSVGEGSTEVQADEIPSEVAMYETYVIAFHYSRGRGPMSARLIDASGLPPQHLRRVVASELGISEWDWKTHPRPTLILDTMKNGFSRNVPVGL